jgi:RNA polymerase sigma factor for flagellar operon FliA
MIGTATDYEQLFLTSLAYIDRAVNAIAQRHALDRTEAEEFAGWAKAKLMDDQYGVFRKFGGRSSINTYLTVVLGNLYRDYRNARWGRWRPSAAAKRVGPTAIRLEELLYRDRMSLREAVNFLRSRDASLNERELARLASSLPAHYPVHEVALESPGVADRIPLAPPPDRAVGSFTADIEQAVRSLMDELPAEDALVVRLRFWSGLTVAEVARTLHLDQKALYRRLEAIAARLRRALESRGVDRATVADLLSEEAD